MFEERQVPEAMQEQLWKLYYNKLSKGIDIGYNPNLEHYNPQLAHSLKYNIAEFSAFKETSFRKELERALTKNGKILPWSDFKKEALRVSGLYNVNYLQTEDRQTVATANMAGKWEDFQQNKDLYPNLRYDAVNDDRTRPQHKEWDGLVAPIDHPIWNLIYPPNDWGCRCGVTQTDEPASANLPSPNIKDTFAHNPAISGKVFNDIPYKAGLGKTDIAEAGINALRYLSRHGDSAVKRNAEHLIYNLPRAKQFVETYSNGKGKVLEHLLVNTNADDYKEILESAKAFAKKGKIAEMMPEIGKNKIQYRSNIFPGLDSLKNPDLRINSIYMDVKRPSAIKNVVGRANNAYKQNSIVIIHTGKIEITEDIMKRRADDIFNDKNVNHLGVHNYPLEVIYFIVKGKLYKFKKH